MMRKEEKCGGEIWACALGSEQVVVFFSLLDESASLVAMCGRGK